MISELLKLSGMAYHGGKFTPEEWEIKTGINPRKLPPGLVEITPRNQLCVWTAKAEAIVSAHSKSIKNNFSAIGV